MESFNKLTEEKQDMILNTCMDAFIQSGYALANTVEIAKNCGIAKGSLFHYFGSKKTLFLHLVRVCIERVMNETGRALAHIDEKTYFGRLRKSVETKTALPLKYPRETAFLGRAFSERGHEAAEEMHDMMVSYTAQLRELNTRYIGDIEPELVREGVNPDDARVYIQTVFDAAISRLMQQYSGNPRELLEKPEVLSGELEKLLGFIMKGVGR
jgi:AcrR family transcriptional regulator